MGLLTWFKKPLKWWLGLTLVVFGTLIMRQVHVWEWAQVAGASMVFVGIVMVLLFGRIKHEDFNS